MSTTGTQPLTAKPIVAKKKSRKRLYWILGGLLVLGVLITAAIIKNKGKEPLLMVTTEKAIIKTITHVVTATGKVQPELEVKISPEVAGELIELPFLEGQRVKKGDTLVRIKPDFYQAQLDQQEASLASAQASSVLSQARLTKAEQDFKQANTLYAKELISDADFTTATANLNVAKADFDSSVAQIRRTDGSLSQARDQLAKTTLYAPMDGTISSLTSEVGERVVGTNQFAGTEIMRVADLANMEVRVKVNENDIVNVKLHDHTVITIDAFPGRRFQGEVYEISTSALSLGGAGSNQSAQAASASDEVTNFLVKIKVSAPDAKLRPGMSATVDIETETVKDVVAVPVQSVTVRAEGGKTTEELQKDREKVAKERSGNDLEVVQEREEAKRTIESLLRVVFVRKGDKVEMRKVETGITDNSHMEIKSGVKAGEEVISGSYKAISSQLKDGAKIMIQQPKPEEKK